MTARTAYDENGAQARQVTYGYGPEGELLSVAGSAEPVTKTYDALYRLKTLKDGNNNQTTYSYNSIGQVASVQMPGGESVQFSSYDANGNLLQRIDGNNVTTNYLYSDAESQLTDIQYPATPNLNVHLAYDGYGRRSSLTDATGGQLFTYGNRDELQSVTTTYTGLSATTISYTYNADGSRQTMTTPAGTFSYNYDGASRMTSLTNPFNETSSWAYQDNNWLNAQTLANGAQTSYSYNALGQMLELTNKNSTSAVLSQFTSMVHDAVGNRTSVTANLPAVPTFSGVTSYQYDTKNQLTQEQTTRNSGYTDTFGYDAAGNPTLFKGTTKTYNANNQQTATGFTHDGNGNPTTYGGNSLSFDAENRLTAYGNVLTAGYTGDGLRAWKQTASGRTYFVYDGVLPVVELDQSGALIATNTFGANGLVSRRVSTTSIFYTFDAQGSVTQRSDASGTTLSTHQFTAHGAELTTASGEPFGYGGQWGYYTDRETGLQLLTHRYYDPANGRFLTRDPISYNGGINVYAYVTNAPVNKIDPYGLDGDDPYLPNSNRKPPGWNPSWPTGQDNRGPYSEDPETGRRYYPHPEDKGHWDHYDDDQGGRYPENSIKPWPGQKRRPRRDQCESDPWPSAKRVPHRPPGPTLEEFLLQEESHRAMERFWKTVIYGSAGAGAVAGGLFVGGPAGGAAVLRWVLVR